MRIGNTGKDEHDKSRTGAEKLGWSFVAAYDETERDGWPTIIPTPDEVTGSSAVGKKFEKETGLKLSAIGVPGN